MFDVLVLTKEKVTNGKKKKHIKFQSRVSNLLELKVIYSIHRNEKL